MRSKARVLPCSTLRAFESSAILVRSKTAWTVQDAQVMFESSAILVWSKTDSTMTSAIRRFENSVILVWSKT